MPGSTLETVVDEAMLARYAELIVGFGANVQSGQIVAVAAELGKEPLTRAVAAAAYRRGARYVDGEYADPHLRRARLRHAAPETLGSVPSWQHQQILDLGEQRCARISLSGLASPGLFDDLDPALVGRDQNPTSAEIVHVVMERTTNWSVVPAPTLGWAELVHPQLEPDAALARLWSEVLHVCCLDEADPLAVCRARADALEATAARLDAARLDAVRFTGPGTDLTIGLLSSSRWLTARISTVDGVEHHACIPSEEVYATPDPERVEGVVRATKPLVIAGAMIEGLEIRFEHGRAVAIDAERGAETLRAVVAIDDGAKRLGEVALVDRAGRVGPLGTVFYDSLLDENAASHIALGRGFDFGVAERDIARVNASDTHVDFMIGSDEVAVTGTTRDGNEIPLLAGGVWQLAS